PPISAPSGAGPAGWIMSMGVPQDSVLRSIRDRDSAGLVSSDDVFRSAHSVIMLKFPAATGQPFTGRQSNPDIRYSVPPFPVANTPFGVVDGWIVPVVRPPAVCVSPSKWTPLGDVPASSWALSSANSCGPLNSHGPVVKQSSEYSDVLM